MDTHKSVNISIIIPTYNHANFLISCVESVLTQINTSFEILIVDDGSTDNTGDVVQSLPTHIKYYRQENSGPASARNNGLANAAGRYVAFLDADDFWLPGFSDLMFSKFETCDDNTALVACGWKRITLDGYFIGSPVLVDENTLNWENLMLGNKLTTSAALLSRNALISVGCFDTDIIGVEDWYLWLKLLNAGYQIRAINEPLVGYRGVPGSISHNTLSMFENSMLVIDKVFSDLSPPETIKDKRAQYYAWRYLDACAGLYENNLDRQALEFFDKAVKIWPNTLSHPHTIHLLIHAKQSYVYKLTPIGLNPEESQTRTRDLLMNYKSDYPHYVAEGLSWMYMILARIAFKKSDFQSSRRLALKSFFCNPSTQAANFFKTLIKTIIN